MLSNPIYAVVGAVIVVIAIAAIAIYGMGGDSVQQARQPPAVLDKLQLTQDQADRGDRRGRERGERRRNRGDGDRGDRRRDRQNRDGVQTPSGGDQQYGNRGYNDDRRGRRGDRGEGRRRGGATNVTWQDASGNRIRLSDFRGRFVVLNLWATWCAPCVTELPALARVQQALANDGVVVIAVDLENNEAAKVSEFLRSRGAGTLAVYIDKDMALMRTFNAYGLPLTILYDKNGREFGRASGPQPWDHPDAIAYLKEMANAPAATSDTRRGRQERSDRGARGAAKILRRGMGRRGSGL